MRTSVASRLWTRLPSTVLLIVVLVTVAQVGHAIYNSFGGPTLVERVVLTSALREGMLGLPFLVFGVIGLLSPARVARIRGIIPFYLGCLWILRGLSVDDLGRIAFDLGASSPHLMATLVALAACFPRDAWMLGARPPLQLEGLH